MSVTDEATGLKVQVREHWERETCGTRYGYSADRKSYFDDISLARYKLEPYIPSFADFPAARGRTVLEIGVGAGADFQHWCEYADCAVGIDLTDAAIKLTDERLQLNGVSTDKYILRSADAEQLPFDDNQFDLVWSWGVLHHTPDTVRAFAEVYRVLKPGGTVKAMIYHLPAWTSLMLWVQYGLMRGRIRAHIRDVVAAHLESPGTKAYTRAEAGQLLMSAGFTDIVLATKLSPGDLLTIQPSERYRSRLFSLIWRFYPRWLVRALGDRFGLNLLIVASKPSLPAE